MTSPILNRLKFGSAAWNHWRRENPDVAIVLDGADLNGMILTGVDFSRREPARCVTARHEPDER